MNSRNRRKPISRRKIAVPLLCLLIAAAIAVLYILLSPAAYICLMRKLGMGGGNSFSPKGPEREQLTFENGIVRISDIAYDTEYPNSFLDLYRQGEGSKPLFLYIHGGGFAWGDKAEGDPNAGTQDPEAATQYLQEIVSCGYVVASINYALTTEYAYPVPVMQIDRAVEFLEEHAEEFGLDMTKVVISGGSAGGQLAGQYANVQTNLLYAEQIGLPQRLGGRLIGIVFNSALLVPAQFGKTGSFATDFMFERLKRAYFGSDPEVLAEGDVIANLSENFPPCFITDGNTATFDAQAVELDRQLQELSVPHVFNYYPKEEVALGHGYDSFLADPYAIDNLDREKEFLKELLR